MLNKRMPYGVVYGPHPACYEQNGNLYDGQGNNLNKKPDQPSPVETKVGKKEEPAKVEVKAPVEMPESRKIEPPKTGPVEVPDFKMELPLKYINNMSIPELKEELDSYGVEYADKVKAAEEAAHPRLAAIKPLLREILSAERGKRGI